MQDILTVITEAEAKAEEIISDAKKRADAIIESSQAEISKRKKEIYDAADKFVKKAIEEKKLLAQFESEKLKTECMADIASLAEASEKNTDKAVEFILNSL